MRRRVGHAVALSLAGVVVLAGCAGTPEGETPAEPQARTVQTLNGEVVVPARPERVATLTWTAPEPLVDLGVTPVAIPDGSDNPLSHPQTYIDALADVPRIGDWNSISFEELLALEPDLIVGSTWDNYERAAQIAPTVEFEERSWHQDHASLAEAVGRVAEFEELRDEFDERVAEITAEYSEALSGHTWVVISGTTEGQWLAEQSLAPSVSLLRTLGAQLDPLSAEEGWWSEPVSMEELGSLEGADVILYSASMDGEVSERSAPVLEHPLYDRLPAVQQGNSFGFAHGSMNGYGWALLALDDLEVLLEQVQAA